MSNKVQTNVLKKIWLGQTAVSVVQYDSGIAGPQFVHVHDNEQTALTAAIHAVGRHGGEVRTLAHSRTRNIAFDLKGASFRVDPNRIFSEKGIISTLTRSGNCTDEAIVAVKKFSGEVVDSLFPAGLKFVAAVHNNFAAKNTDENFSIYSFMAGGPYQSEAEDVFLSNNWHPDNFCFVTQRRRFEELKALKLSVVLQKEEFQVDDGSLSIWSANQDMDYVNVEAQHGHLAQQTEMLNQLAKIIGT